MAAGAGAGAGAPAAGRAAAPGSGEKTARRRPCCGQDMTKLGVSTFQLGEHTFWAVTWTICCSGSMKMAVFPLQVCGRLKF